MGFGRRLLGKDGKPPGEVNVDALSAALDDVPAGFALFDSEDRLVLCNPAFREVFEAADDPIPDGAKYAAIFRGAAVKGRVDGIRRDEESWLDGRIKAHNAGPNRFTMTLRNGRVFEIDERRLPNNSTAMTLLDITDYERREAASSTNEQKARAMLDSVFDGVLTIGADGVIDSVNARTAEIFGRPIEMIIGNTTSLLVPDVTLSDFLASEGVGINSRIPRSQGGRRVLEFRNRGQRAAGQLVIARSPPRVSQDLRCHYSGRDRTACPGAPASAGAKDGRDRYVGRRNRT